MMIAKDGLFRSIELLELVLAPVNGPPEVEEMHAHCNDKQHGLLPKVCSCMQCEATRSAASSNAGALALQL